MSKETMERLSFVYGYRPDVPVAMTYLALNETQHPREQKTPKFVPGQVPTVVVDRHLGALEVVQLFAY